MTEAQQAAERLRAWLATRPKPTAEQQRTALIALEATRGTV